PPAPRLRADAAVPRPVRLDLDRDRRRAGRGDRREPGGPRSGPGVLPRDPDCPRDRRRADRPHRVLPLPRSRVDSPQGVHVGRRAGRPEPRLQHVQEATRRRPALDVPRLRRLQRRVSLGHPVQRLHPRGAEEGQRRDGGGRGPAGMMDTEYGPGRTIPHPVMFRVLDSEADDLSIPEIRVEHKSEFAYYPGCVDYYDVEMQFSHMNYGDTNHGIIFDSSIKLLRAVGIQPMILDRSFMKCCGHDQLWQGKVDVFERMRDYNTRIVKM